MKLQTSEEKQEMVRNIIKAALEDKSFRKRLTENPEAGVRELYPEYTTNNPIITDQTTTQNQYLNISRLSYALHGGDVEDVSMELEDEDLEMVAGGGWTCPFWSCNAPSTSSGISG